MYDYNYNYPHSQWTDTVDEVDLVDEVDEIEVYYLSTSSTRSTSSTVSIIKLGLRMLIDGNVVAKKVQERVKEQILELKERRPCLAVILVGNNPASEIYIRRKTLACEEVGITSLRLAFPAELSEADLLKELHRLNKDPKVDGILVQLPLPPQIHTAKVIQSISPEKDVDGFHPTNMGKLLIGEADGFVPCTPLGIQKMLQHYEIQTSGKHAVILGRSNIVGKPLAALLMQPREGGNATVTIAHSKTEDLQKICHSADILIAAIGQPRFVKASMVKKGAVVIDVGINKIDDASTKSGYRLVGDVDFENVKEKCSFISPVPGGVGPMTIAMLLQNTLAGYLKCTKQ